MAQNSGAVYVQVEPSMQGVGDKIEKELAGSIDKAGKEGTAGLSKRFTQVFAIIAKAGGDVLRSFSRGLSDLSGEGGFERALAIDAAQAKLAQLGAGAGQATQAIGDAFTAVKNTGMGLDQAASASAELSLVTAAAGDRMAQVLMATVGGAQRAGGGLIAMGSAFGAVASGFQAQGGALSQPIEGGISALEVMGKQLGSAGGQIQQLADKCKSGFQSMKDSIQKGFGGPLPRLDWSGILDDAKLTVKVVENAFSGIGKAGAYCDTFGGHVVDGFKALPAKVEGAMSGLGRFKGFFNKDIREAMAIDGDPFAGGSVQVGKGIEKLTAPLATLGGKFAATGIGGKIAGLGSSISNGLSKLTGSAGAAISSLGSKMGGGFDSAMQKIGGSRVGQALSKVGSTVKNGLSGLGDVFGGLGQMVSGPIRSGLDKVGSVFGTFFSPGNFVKFFGFAGIAAALVTGLGLVDQSMGGQLTATVANLSAKVPAFITGFIGQFMTALPQFMASGMQILMSLISGLTTALPLLVEGAGTIITTMLNGLLVALPQFVPAAVTMITALISALVTQLPLIMTAGLQLLNGLIMGLISALPQLIPAVITMITSLLTALVMQLPLLMTAGMQLLNGLIQGLVTALPLLVAQLPLLINALLTGIVSMLPTLLTGGVQLLMGLINGIVQTVPVLVAQLPVIINAFIGALTTNLPQIIQAGISVLLALISGLINALPQLVAQIPIIIAGLVNALSRNLPQIITAGVAIIVSLASGLVQAIPQLLEALPRIVDGIRSGFSQVNWGEVGGNIIDGIANGIRQLASRLWETAKNVAKGALDKVKGVLGIHSPSRVFRDQVGVMIGRGMAQGIDKSAADVQDSMDGLSALTPSLDFVRAYAGMKLPSWGASGHLTDEIRSDTDLVGHASRQDIYDAVSAALNSGVTLHLNAAGGRVMAGKLAKPMNYELERLTALGR